jgi:hypothetical protein
MALVRGQLAALSVAGTGTLTDVYTVPAAKQSDVNINIANRADTNTLLRVAVIKNNTASGVAVEDYIMYDLPTSALASHYAPITLDGTLMEVGDTIAVYSSASAVSVQVNGIEEDL